MLKNEKKVNEIFADKLGSLTKSLHLENATIRKLTAKLKEKQSSRPKF
jgi:hypothetical protein